MAKFVITGGKKLEGSVRVSGAKNSVLPFWLLPINHQGNYFKGLSGFSRYKKVIGILEAVGCKVKREGSTLIVIHPPLPLG